MWNLVKVNDQDIRITTVKKIGKLKFLVTNLCEIIHLVRKHNFPKTNTSYLLIRIRTYAYQEATNVSFRKILCMY